MVKLKKKSLSRGSFRTHGRVIKKQELFYFWPNTPPCWEPDCAVSLLLILAIPLIESSAVFIA